MSIEHVKTKGKNSYARPQDSFNIISGSDRVANAKVEVAKVNDSETDLLTGAKKIPVVKPPPPAVVAPTPAADAGPHEPSRVTTSKLSQTNNDRSTDVITGRHVDPQKKLGNTRGSFSKELKENLEDNVDPITLRPMSHSLLRQGAAPQATPAVGGIFLDFVHIDDNSLKCGKCSKPIYIGGVFAAKGAYIEDKALYNAKKGGHEICFFHPAKATIDPEMQKAEFGLYQCCLGTLQSDGCQLRT